MSTFLHCDNAACTEQRNLDAPRRLPQPDWIEVRENGRDLHFHDAICLAEHLSPLLRAEAAG